MIIIHKTNEHRIIGLASALKYIGEDISFWDSELISAFDMCKLKAPKYVIIEDRYINQSLVDASIKYKVALIPYGVFQGTPVKLNLVHETVPPKIRQNLNMYYTLNLAADYARFSPNKEHKVEKSGLFIRYPDTPITSEAYEFILGLAKLPKTLPIRICSNQHIPSPYYVGWASDKQVKNELARSEFLISFDNHYYDAIINKTVPFDWAGKNRGESVENYSGQPKLAAKFLKNNYSATINSNTYFSRLVDIGTLLEEKEWVLKCKSTLMQIQS